MVMVCLTFHTYYQLMQENLFDISERMARNASVLIDISYKMVLDDQRFVRKWHLKLFV